MYHPACWVVFTATAALLFIPGRAESFFSRGWGGCGSRGGRGGRAGAGGPGLHARCARTHAGRRAASCSAAGNRQALPGSGVWRAVPVPRGRGITQQPPGWADRVRPLGQPLAANDGVMELFPLQSWAPPVPSLSAELSRSSPCSRSSLIPARQTRVPAARSPLQSGSEPPRYGHPGGAAAKPPRPPRAERVAPETMALSPWLAGEGEGGDARFGSVLVLGGAASAAPRRICGEGATGAGSRGEEVAGIFIYLLIFL